MDLGEVDDLLNNMSRHTHVVMEEEQEGNLKRQTNAIHHAREELQRRDEIIRTMQARILQLEHHEKLIHSLNERITALEAVEQEKLSVDSELVATTEELVEKKAHIADLSSQLLAERTKAEELEELTTSLRDEIKSGEDNLTESQRRSVLLEKLAENLKSELDGSEAHLSAEIQKQIELTNKFERSSHEWAQVTMKHESDMAEAHKTNEKLKEDNIKLHLDLKHAKNEAERWKRLAGESEDNLASTKDTMTEENENLANDLGDVKTSLSSVRSDYSSLQERNDQLHERMALVTQEMESLRRLGWPRNKMYAEEDIAEADEQGEDHDVGQHCADMRACARNLQRILDSCRDDSFHKRAPLPPATPISTISTPATSTRGPNLARRGTPGSGAIKNSNSHRTPGSGFRNTYSAPPGSRATNQKHQVPRSSGYGRTVPTPASSGRRGRAWDASSEEKAGDSSLYRGMDTTGAGVARDSMRPAHGWSQSLSFPSFDTMLEGLIEGVDEAARLREQLADAQYKWHVSDSACKDATELLGSFEHQLREQRRATATLELFAVNLNDIVTSQGHLAAQQRASGIHEDFASVSIGGVGVTDATGAGMGSYTHTGAGAGSNEEDFRDLEIRLGELMLLDTKKEKKGSRSRLVGVPTDVNDSDGAGAPHTKGPLSHLRSLCASVQKSASLLEAYRVDLVDKTMSERALKLRVNELLGLVERLKEEHNRQLDEHEQEQRRKFEKAMKVRVAAVEAEKEKVLQGMQKEQKQHYEALDAARREAQHEVQSAKETLQAEYTAKVNDMVIATAEMEIMKDESSSQMREWTLLLDKLVRYMCTLQAKYDDLCSQKRLLLAFSHGLDALRDDLLFLSLACVETSSTSPASFASELLVDAPIEFSPAVMHKLHRMSNSGGYQLGYPTATLANRRREDGKRGRKYTVPSLRVVAIYILAALRFRRILTFIRSRVKNTLFMKYDGYAETTQSLTAVEGLELKPGQDPPSASGGGYSGGADDPSGTLESTLRFPVPSYSELCRLTPAQVASFVVRSKRGEARTSSDLFGALNKSSSPAHNINSDNSNSNNDEGGISPNIGGLLHSITTSGYGAGHSPGGEGGEDADEGEDASQAQDARYNTPSRGRGDRVGGALSKLHFLSSSPYSPELLQTASRLRPPSSSSPAQQGGESFTELTGVGTGHVRSRFLWNVVPGITDYFCLSQTAVIERALVYMSGRLASLREEDEALKGAVNAYESNKRNYDEALDASMSTVEQQARTIKTMSQHNASKDKNILKIALGHRRMAAVVQASGQVTGNIVRDTSGASHTQTHPRRQQQQQQQQPLELSRGREVPGKVASTAPQAPEVVGSLNRETIRDLEDAGRMAEAEELGAWRRTTFGHMEDGVELE